MTPSEQARVFLAMTMTGCCLGAAYDMLGIFRAGGLCAAADLVYGAVCAAGIIAAALIMQCEPFRLYTFAGTAFGMLLYSVTLGTMLRLLSANVRKIVEKSEKKHKKGQSDAGN